MNTMELRPGVYKFTRHHSFGDDEAIYRKKLDYSYWTMGTLSVKECVKLQDSFNPAFAIQKYVDSTDVTVEFVCESDGSGSPIDQTWYQPALL